MIRLNRVERPALLDDETIAELTDNYAESGDSVWNVDFIKMPLLESSHGKCAYCETKVTEESKYMEVEHYRCKQDFPALVVNWENLLPSCKRCNGAKHNHNVETEGLIINPYDQEPRDYIYLDKYRLRWRNDVGRRTIDTVYLNDTERLVRVRWLVGEQISASLEVLRQKLEEYIAGNGGARKRNQIVKGLEALLWQAQAKSEYCAVAATVLLRDPNFGWIKEGLIELSLWADLSELAEAAESFTLDP